MSPKRMLHSPARSPGAVRAPALHVTMVSSEISPFAKTGGLGDVLGSLPVALERLGIHVSLIMPAYRSVLQGAYSIDDTGIRISVPVSDRIEEGAILKGKLGKAITVFFIRADKYFDRDNLYFDAAGDYPDNAERFIFFSRAVLEVLKSQPTDILHAHDWQTALSIVFLKSQPELFTELAGVKTVFTIHNLGHQGIFWNLDWHLLNLDRRFFAPQYLEFYDRINFLKGGIVFADEVTTVSPTYASEIQAPEYGFGLEGVFRDRADRLAGILNGIDYRVWNPETDTLIARTYSADDLAGKARCKAALQKAFGLQENPDVPIIGMVTRLSSQKGMDILSTAIDSIMTKNVQFVLLGGGEQRYADLFTGLPGKYPGKAGVRIAIDEAMVHQVIAGSDFLLIPSRYEPCGLTQLQGLRYGTIPVARATGGLKDTIQEFNPATGEGTGFLFTPYEASALMNAVDRALVIFRQDDSWITLRRNAMKANFYWEKSARIYKELYHQLVAGT